MSPLVLILALMASVHCPHTMMEYNCSCWGVSLAWWWTHHKVSPSFTPASKSHSLVSLLALVCWSWSLTHYTVSGSFCTCTLSQLTWRSLLSSCHACPTALHHSHIANILLFLLTLHIQVTCHWNTECLTTAVGWLRLLLGLYLCPEFCSADSLDSQQYIS